MFCQVSSSAGACRHFAYGGGGRLELGTLCGGRGRRGGREQSAGVVTLERALWAARSQDLEGARDEVHLVQKLLLEGLGRLRLASALGQQLVQQPHHPLLQAASRAGAPVARRGRPVGAQLLGDGWPLLFRDSPARRLGGQPQPRGRQRPLEARFARRAALLRRLLRRSAQLRLDQHGRTAGLEGMLRRAVGAGSRGSRGPVRRRRRRPERGPLGQDGADAVGELAVAVLPEVALEPLESLAHLHGRPAVAVRAQEARDGLVHLLVLGRVVWWEVGALVGQPLLLVEVEQQQRLLARPRAAPAQAALEAAVVVAREVQRHG